MKHCSKCQTEHEISPEFWYYRRGKPVICKAAQKRYHQSPAGKESHRVYAASKKGKAVRRRYNESKAGRASRKKYSASSAGKLVSRNSAQKHFDRIIVTASKQKDEKSGLYTPDGYIDRKWVLEQQARQNNLCYRCNVPMKSGIGINRKSCRNGLTVERLQNDKCHLKTNCVLVHKHCQYMNRRHHNGYTPKDQLVGARREQHDSRSEQP